MIKLIVGLGNPGQQYDKTRHNAGFLFTDSSITEYGGHWSNETKFNGWLAECTIGSKKALLLKPNTFMNRSGQAVVKVAKYYKLQTNEILVVHDELDFDTGIAKLKYGGGHAGHNGLRDIILHLASKDFYRLRLGIGRPAVDKAVADYVLSAPSKQEYELLINAINYSQRFLSEMLSGDMAAVMNQLNTRT